MDEVYDFVVLGTGLKECILSGLMSVAGKKVLHLDRNKHYGGSSTSMSPLDMLFKHFGMKCTTEEYGRGRDWNVDLIPKFLMGRGNLVKLLIHTGVTRYLEFRCIEGSFVYHKRRIHKVPSSEKEALNTSLVSFLEKYKLRNFLKFVHEVEPDQPATWNKVYAPPNDIKRATIQLAYDKFGISEEAQNFIGHALCLYSNDRYKTSMPALDSFQRMHLYNESLNMFGQSPYVYPLYGLGELPQAFARLSAVYGGTYMLDKPVDEIVVENGRVVGVKAQGEIARCHTVICDPSYALERVRKVGQVIRAICILTHPITDTKGASSAQIIIPQSETGRHNDIYVCCMSSQHMVCPQGFYVALVASTVETDHPEAELKPGLDLLQPIKKIFLSVDDLYEPADDGTASRVFVSKSYDSSTHFESTCADVLDMYHRITGEPFDFSQVKKNLTDDDE